MGSKFNDLVKNKTKDELINIILNRTEFKNELVEAAEDELKFRQGQKETDNPKLELDNKTCVEYEDDIKDLKNKINRRKTDVISLSADNEIIEKIESTITTKDIGIAFVRNYRIVHGFDVIEDLKLLSKNYDIIKKYLNRFIELEIVEKSYPHKTIGIEPFENKKKEAISQKSIIISIGVIIMLIVAFYYNSDSDTKYQLKESTVDKYSYGGVDIIKQSVSYNSYMNSYSVYCRVRNNSSDLVSYLDIVATFYDKNGRIVGTGLGNAVNLASGAEKTVEIISLDIDNAAKYDIQINNVMKK